ncbi:ABC transporter substrate-binding protein [Singulisphaera sp. PoT]|uniref:ABC transporter substrate-binding protein n=1 Tax=Singulisphaera sp. PoT TaxID=3411797 RepID=UPI003BF5B69F
MNPHILIRARLGLIAALIGSLPACSRQAAPSAPAKLARHEVRTDSWPVEIVDGLGRKVRIARPPERIVSLTPSNTETLYAVGAGGKVVAGTSLDDYPPEVKKHATVGGMAPRTINLEAIAALKPDLVLASGGVQEPIIAPLERLGLVVVALDAEDFEGVARNIRTVGRLTGRSAEAERLSSRFLDRVEAVRRRAGTRTAPKPKVLYLVREDPLMTAGPGTFIGRMIEVAGGINTFGDVSIRYPRPSEEEVLARSPEIILASTGAMNGGSAGEPARRQRILSRAGWDRLPAIRGDRISFLDEDLVSRPGPRLVEGLEAMAKALDIATHPRSEDGNAEPRTDR